MSLKPTTLAAINTALTALVNAGGVRPEDQSDVSEAMARLAEDEAEYAEKFADLDARLTAIEDGLNGAADALTPAPAAQTAADPAPETATETDPTAAPAPEQVATVSTAATAL